MAWVAATMMAGCQREKPVKTAAPKPLTELFAVKVGSQTVRMQLAVAEPERRFGLMGRRDLLADQGMLFIFDAPQRLNFYMRNTPTPLDIGYFTRDGVLREIYQMYPFDESRVSSKRSDLQFALEMKQGWFKEHEIKPGASLEMKELIAALRERGTDPQKKGIGDPEK
jgi:uncharacterized membrane protein (UPF0127 family)